MTKRSPEKKIGRRVMQYVEETLSAMADTPYIRTRLFNPGRRVDNNKLTSKWRREELIEHMQRFHKGDPKYKPDSIKRALSFYVHFLPAAKD